MAKITQESWRNRYYDRLHANDLETMTKLYLLTEEGSEPFRYYQYFLVVELVSSTAVSAQVRLHFPDAVSRVLTLDEGAMITEACEPSIDDLYWRGYLSLDRFEAADEGVIAVRELVSM